MSSYSYELLLDRGDRWQAAGIFPTWRDAFKAGDQAGGRFSVNPVKVKELDAERQRLELELRARAPLQSRGKPVADAGHLPLFIAGNEPSLF